MVSSASLVTVFSLEYSSRLCSTHLFICLLQSVITSQSLFSVEQSSLWMDLLPSLCHIKLITILYKMSNRLYDPSKTVRRAIP